MPEPGYNPNAVSSYYNPNKTTRPKLRPKGLGSRPSGTSRADRKGESAVFSAPKPVYSSNNNNNDNKSDKRLTPASALYSATATSLAESGAKLSANKETRITPMGLYNQKNMQEMKTELEDYLRGVAVEDGIAADMADMAVPEVYTGEVEDVTVKAGDTLTAIAKDKGVSLQELIDANPQIANPDMIRPGEKVVMPSKNIVTTPSTATEDTTTEVRTLTGMEKRYISDSLPSWQKAQGLPIYRRGRFHKPTLIKSINKAGLTGDEASLLKGAIKSEIGTNAPGDERKYTYRGAAAYSSKWKSRMDAEGLGTNATGAEIFNAVYANRNGNGDYASGDGNRYKGRGLVQITGRGNYQAVQDKLAETGLNIDIMNNPSLINDEKYALPAALAMLDIMGINSSNASTMTAKTLNNAINSRADSTKAKARWANVIAAASTADKADLKLRDDYAAQEEVGLSGSAVDGDIGVNTKAEIDTWAASKGLTVPAVTEITKIRQNGTSYQTFSPEDKLKLTKFVNENK